MGNNLLNSLTVAIFSAAVCAVGTMTGNAAQVQPRSGGELVFPVPSEPPSYDGHREEPFGLIHPFAPFYNTLLRVDPNDKSGTKPYPSLAESWIVSPDGKAYAFKLRPGVKFQDGSEMTSKDVKASYDKIIFPAAGVGSTRKGQYAVVDAVEAPNPTTVVFKLKYASGSFLSSPPPPPNFPLKARHSRQGSALVREEHHGHRPVRLRRARQGFARGGQEVCRLLGQGQALSGRLPRHLHARLRGAGSGGTRRAGAHPVPQLHAEGPRQSEGRPRRQDHRAGIALGLHPDGRHQPPEKTVR